MKFTQMDIPIFKISCCVAVLMLIYQAGHAQNDTIMKMISFTNLDAFADPPKNWIIAAGATSDFSKPNDLKPLKGTGAVVNDLSKNNRMHLFTKEEFGDLELEMDFMMAKNSNSGIYLQGRYEIQLLDSWTKLNLTASDAGGIYSRWTEQRGNYEGTAPLMNVARAPGLWQHLKLLFRAPRFNDKGEKIRDARFEQVYLNEVLVQQSANITGPTRSAMFTDEKSRGPLVLQGDHGPVAFRNISYRQPGEVKERSNIAAGYWEARNPILINPQSKNYLLRSFLEYGKKTLTHVISVGSPAELNYAYDLKQGALIEIWRGNFLDVTRMWLGRGEPQLARPLGSVVRLNDAPAVAVLANENMPWPDSVAFDDLQSHGYTLNKQRTPVFTYSIRGTEVKDSIAFEANGEGITRSVMVTNPPTDMYCRIADGKTIEHVNDNLYTIDDRTMYIRLDKKYKPVIRPSAKGSEMLVRFSAAGPLTYSIVW